MNNIPEKDVDFVVSGIEGNGNYVSIDHYLKEVVFPSARYSAQDLWIVSPYLIPDIIFPTNIKKSRPSRRDIHSYMDDEDIARLRGWFKSFTKQGDTRINLITNSITYDQDEFNLEERKTFARLLLEVFGQDNLKMTSVFELSEENRPPNAISGIHAKAIIAGRRAAYLGSGNFTRGGFVNNIEFGVGFTGYHEVVGSMLETCRKLASSDYFDAVHIGKEGELTNQPQH